MSLQTFFDNFGLTADAPNGVQELRGLVLDLAVQGSFDTQSPADEPANILLEKILGITYARLFSEPESVLFGLPENWLWIRFGDVYDIQGGTQPPKSEFAPSPSDGYVRLLQIRDFGNRPEPVYIKRDSVKSFCTTTDVMLARYGASVGKVFMGQDGAYNVALTKIIFNHDCLYNRFVFYLLRSSLFQDWLRPMSRSAQAGFNKGNIHPIPLPLPPLEEQKRIVTKVDELMRLCDELEARHQVRRESRVRLNNAMLGPFNSAGSLAPGEFEQASRRLADNFGALYDSAETVGKLRSAILQLAIQGKLGPQDPHDEPASLLLEKLKEIKASSNNRKKNKKTAPLPIIESDQTPFPLPAGWQWSRFFDIATIASNLVSPENYLDYPHVAPDNIEKFTGKLLPYRSVREDKVASSNHKFFSGQIVYSKIRPNLAKAVLIDFDGLCSADMYPINSHIDSEFLLRYMLSETFLRMAVKGDTRVVMPKINQDELNKTLVPVPPFEEQKRIVAKVNQLMTLCDELETKLRQAEADSEKLMNAAVQHVLKITSEETKPNELLSSISA